LEIEDKVAGNKTPGARDDDQVSLVHIAKSFSAVPSTYLLISGPNLLDCAAN
jgi:hypothetical protein